MEAQEALFDAIADALVERGYWIADEVLPASLSKALLNDFDQLQASEFKSAGIGRQTDFQLEEKIRADKIHWLAGDTEATADFLQWMDLLKSGLNRRLFMGLFDYESHFAHYPVGAFYKKHVDAFRAKDGRAQSNRVLSTVFYLNENWLPENGGELLIYDQSDSGILHRLSPVFGRLVIFLSEKFPHEVLPANRERKSIAGWFRVNESII
ncbi:prolyl 4-hydroxylase subunit alpha [Cellvibrio zantedeschiae]|uniref:Prolyl 4-hydroxylase subunit alpha n=1 Tax=Cellvibrio zantedeschiae TaxID=1237077 RepID=A0ABQ3AUG6_9GAMM|nr:2OG-Fe(II) oxygenase [Cellvibrio zantedeschiae]GGY66480.1 prolyl 4-hydroxylase subunit alpha [Cellvibrio zantedeschiae]